MEAHYDLARHRTHSTVPAVALATGRGCGDSGLGRSTIYELLRAGELPTVHIGRTTRIPARDLQSWIEQRRSVNGLGAGKSNSARTGASDTP